MCCCNRRRAQIEYLTFETIAFLAAYSTQQEMVQEELRLLGGLEDLVNFCDKRLKRVLDEPMLRELDSKATSLYYVSKCLAIAQSSMFYNPTNQQYLLHHRDGRLLDMIAGVVDLCDKYVAAFPWAAGDARPGEESLCDSLCSAFRVLMSITHHSRLCIGDSFGVECRAEPACDKLTHQRPLMAKIVRLVFQFRHSWPAQYQFDIQALVRARSRGSSHSHRCRACPCCRTLRKTRLKIARCGFDVDRTPLMLFRSSPASWCSATGASSRRCRLPPPSIWSAPAGSPRRAMMRRAPLR